MDETVLDLIRSHMRDVKVATAYDKVYKDECMFCFATSETPGGLYINLKTFQAFDEEHVDLDQERTGSVLYLHEQAHRVPLSEEEVARTEEKPDKLAIGGEGGFQVDAKKYKIEKEYALVLMPARLRVELPCPQLPELVLTAISAVQAHDSANVEANVAAWQEERAVSRHAENLEQLPASRKIPMDPKQWKCDETGVTENLWLNLSTGFIGSGRQQWDGSGGNNSALRHYEATGSKYPLAVKLGTITPHGADVYSYAEDDMVLDPHLAQHLAHWGINMLQMEKTEKTMAELQIDLNLAAEFDRITEAGARLQPVHGPGYVGLKNLGNSCYMNSVLQLLWTLPELRQRYVAPAGDVFRSAPAEPANDFPTQLAKVGAALVEGRTGRRGAGGDTMNYDAVTVTTEGGLEGAAEGATADEWTVSPLAFKTLVGRGHPEFSSMRQQDAEEYWGYLLEAMTRAERAAGARLAGAAEEPTSALFKFALEDRIQCLESGRVAYRRGGSSVLGLEIPLEAATNAAELDSYRQRQSEREQKRQKVEQEGAAAADALPREEGEERVIPTVPFSACLDRFAADSLVDDYHSAALGRKTQASKRVRFGSFPPYLLLQLRRYYVAPDWTPRKMEVLVEVPDSLDLEHLRARGPQPEEQLQPEEEEGAQQPQQAAAAGAPAPAAAAAPQPDDTIVAQLVSMGFSENGSKRAALAVSNAGAEAAMEWVFAHMTDPDFNDPLPPPGQPAAAAAAAGAAGTAGPAVSAEALSMLTAMGFTDRQATAALTACGGSAERAGDWLFSHMDDMDTAVEAALAPAAGAGAAGGDGAGGSGAAAPAPSAAASKVLDGPGRYELVGIISHMGSNTACGHYVAHIKKEGRWVIFNDEKVALSERPPRELGYLYLFKRADAAAA